MKPLTAAALFAIACAPVSARSPDAPSGQPQSWTDALRLPTPAVADAPGFDDKGVRAIFFDGPAWRGKKTRVFAYVGVPAGAAASHKAPAMVLVHGGGGTAFADWVRLWTSRGYCAIAMDTCGCVPKGTYGNWQRLPDGGPPGWGGFDQIADTPHDQWTWQAIADVILAHTVIASMPEVDPRRIGLTGISWGGYLTCIAAGVDHRFRFAAPVYGCGYLGDDSVWTGDFARLGSAGTTWLRMWDPSVYLKDARLPMLWVTGTNDFAYPMDSLQKSYRRAPGRHTLAIRLRMPHAHGGPGENPEEIRAFADAFCKSGAPLPRLGTLIRNGDQLTVAYQSKETPLSADVSFTRDTGPWPARVWQASPARIDAAAHRVQARLPDGARTAYINLFDSAGRVVSSEHFELP